MALSLSASQVACINTILGVCKQENAPYNAQMAAIYAAGAENGFSPNNTFQATRAPSDTATETHQFLHGIGDFANGGAIALANAGHPPWQIANACEVNAVYIASGGSSANPNATGDSYAVNAYSSIGGQAGGLAQATAIVAQYGAGIPKGGTAGLGGTGTPASQPSATQLQIGQTGNPNEDYWTGINRLASDVSWYLYSDGERLHYMDGADLIVQKPAMYVDRIQDADKIQHLSITWDNSAFQYSSTHKRKQHVQHRTRLAHVSSPTEARLDIICDWDWFRGGDVVVLEACGPGDGRWLVANCTRSLFQIFSSLTLVPPIMPLSEAQAVGTTGASGGAKSGSSIINPKTGKTVGGKGGYQNPFPGGWIPNRLDMGYDGSFTGQIVAPFDGTITYAASSFSNWGGYVELKSASGTIPGLQTDTLYFAEGVAPLVSAGQHVTAGTPICRGAPSPYGNAYATNSGGVGEIEWGPAQPGTVGGPTDPLAKVSSDPAGMVLAFAKWAEQTLGLPPPSTTGDAGHA